MASGYEKAACGVDPAKGWGRPSRRATWATMALVLILGAPSAYGLILTVRGLLGL